MNHLTYVPLSVNLHQMSGRNDDIFIFDSSESAQIDGSSLMETINFSANEPQNISEPLNYQTTRRIEQARSMLKNHSLLAYESIQTGQPISLIKAKLKAKLSPNWTIEKEKEIFSNNDSSLATCKDYTIVTPSHTFIEIDDTPHNNSFASSFGASGSYKATFSPASFKSPDRLKHFK